MSLLEPPAEPPKKHYVLKITIAAVVLVMLLALWFTFRYYPEKKAAGQFFAALTAGDTAKAYALWKPSATYSMNDFLADWGPTGYYGPVRSYRIMDAKAVRQSASIEVNVAISPFSPMPVAGDAEKSIKTKVATIWVTPADKSLSFPVPY
ncbi:MAG TPA: hypothetical protein VN830_00830 [Verrucomicrobiae bacterium]|nr:hypothetical protein [Verrucomicrobiae bacterium]